MAQQRGMVASPGRSQPSPGVPANGVPAKPHPLQAVEAATQRVAPSSLQLGKLKSLRILNESRFLEVIERAVKDRLRSQPAAPARAPAPEDIRTDDLRRIRAEYQARWAEFRRQYEAKLQALEGLLHGKGPPPAGDPPPLDR